MRVTLRSWLRWIVPAVLGLAHLAATAQDAGLLSAMEEASLQEIREFARLTAERYRMVAPLENSVASWVGNPSLPQYASSPAVYTGGRLFLSRRLLTASNRDLVIATAMAYEMFRGSLKAATVVERERERAQMRLDANARAVDIMMRVKDMPEREALDQMYAWLLGMHRAALASGRPPAPGNFRPCDAIGDLLRRYPDAKEWFAGRECAPS